MATITATGSAPYNGFMRTQTINGSRDGGNTLERNILRRSWNKQNVSINGYNRVITPFRSVNFLGDFLARPQYQCGGSSQVNHLAHHKRANRGNNMISVCDNKGVQGACCNPKFVSDSSDFIRYKRMRASNRNYNDLSNGGDQSNASYVALMAVRRS